MLHRVGTGFGESGQVATALGHFRRLVEATTARLGPDHPDTLAARHHASRWQGEAGRRGGRDRGDRVARRLPPGAGPDHPHTLNTREAWDVARAAAGFSDLRRDELRVLDEDHPETPHTRSYPTRLQGLGGDAAGAAAAFPGLLVDYLRVLGADHVHTLTIRFHLASWTERAGDPASATTAFAGLLEDWVRLLGADPPGARTVRAGLAHARGTAVSDERAAGWRASPARPGPRGRAPRRPLPRDVRPHPTGAV
ncbi:hypothetical protein [Streptomyces sp. E-15]